MAGASARILYVGHATVVVEMDGVRLLTDPVLRPRLMHLRRVASVDPGVVRDIDAVLVSHLHFDHLDLPSLVRLGRDVPLVVPRGAGGLLRRKGFTSVSELGVGDELRVGPIAIRATPAVHDAGRVPFGIRADPLGYTFSGSRSVHFAGDTDLFDEMASLGPVDVALLPIWGWGPSLGRGLHLTPVTAAEAARRLRPSIAIPIHWGTYFPAQTGLRGPPAFIDTPIEAFQKAMRERAPEIEVRALRPGEETIV